MYISKHSWASTTKHVWFCISFLSIIFTFLAQYNIQRTCTSEIKINMFMVDRVCMSESNRRGKLCFCEDVSCNEAAKNQPNLFEFLAATFPRRHYSRQELNLPTLFDEISSVIVGFKFIYINFSNGLLLFSFNDVFIYIIQITIFQLMCSYLNINNFNTVSIQFLWSIGSNSYHAKP